MSDIVSDFVGEYIYYEKDFNKSIMALIKGEYGFNSSRYKDIKRRQEEVEYFLDKPFETDEGVLQCSKCKSKRTISQSKQTRKSDEAISVFAICIECGHSWKE